MYKFYCTLSSTPVDYTTYKSIINLWGEKAIEYLVQGKDIQLPSKLSYIGIRKILKPTYVDYQESRRQKKCVVKPNTHSSFYGTKLFWNSHFTRFDVNHWSLTASRKLKQAVKRVMIIPNGHTNFVRNTGVYNNFAKQAYREHILKIKE